MENKTNLNLGVLNDLDGELVKNTDKLCIIEKIINSVPEEYQEQLREVLENKKTSAIAVVKTLRRIGIKEGAEDSVLKHRRQDCICYL